MRLRGSSPRVWGQDDVYESLGCYKRIIPTRMGTSTSKVNIPDNIEDHPHAYGDKDTLLKRIPRS